MINMGCPMCGGPGMLLGQLGRLTHLRCRDCGMVYHLDEGTALADSDWD